MSFNFHKVMLKAFKELKIFIDAYVNNMDYGFMSEISKKNINSISVADFNKLGIISSTYHKITFIPVDELSEMGYDENPNDELQLNENAKFFVFQKLPFYNSGFILEFHNNICTLIKEDIVKIELTTGNDLINEIYEYLNIETYEEELDQVISDYQKKVIETDL